MCKILEDMRNESWREGKKDEKKSTVFRMTEEGKYALEEIAKISGLSIAEVEQIQADQSV